MRTGDPRHSMDGPLDLKKLRCRDLINAQGFSTNLDTQELLAFSPHKHFLKKGNHVGNHVGNHCYKCETARYQLSCLRYQVLGYPALRSWAPATVVISLVMLPIVGYQPPLLTNINQQWLREHHVSSLTFG